VLALRENIDQLLFDFDSVCGIERGKRMSKEGGQRRRAYFGVFKQCEAVRGGERGTSNRETKER
jgi:hypothetical protein